MYKAAALISILRKNIAGKPIVMVSEATVIRADSAFPRQEGAFLFLSILLRMHFSASHHFLFKYYFFFMKTIPFQSTKKTKNKTQAPANSAILGYHIVAPKGKEIIARAFLGRQRRRAGQARWPGRRRVALDLGRTEGSVSHLS